MLLCFGNKIVLLNSYQYGAIGKLFLKPFDKIRNAILPVLLSVNVMKLFHLTPLSWSVCTGKSY
jgi:hypothetical protein